MKTLKVTLKQHTPLIHFQHYQDGATLRASEVKPKLDRFILEKLGNGQYQEGLGIAKANKWLVGKGEHPALDYKMSIKVIGEPIIWDINEPVKSRKSHEYEKTKKGLIKLRNYPAFFANMDCDYSNPHEYKRFSFAANGIIMDMMFKDQNKSLYEWINRPVLISEFFFSYNFGMRNSKGFGSFYPDPNDGLYQTLFAKYSFCSSNGMDQRAFKTLFTDIDLFYKTLRGGINEKDRDGNTTFYFKSLLRQYCQDKLGTDWGKRKIQDFLFGIHTGSDFHDVKDLLGFSTEETWKGELYHNATVKKTMAIQDGTGSWREPVAGEKKSLPDRMQSPILFKPIFNEENKCFDVYLRFMSKRVDLAKFLLGKKIAVTVRGRIGTVIIDLPQEFKLNSLMKYIFDELKFDINTYVDCRYQDHDYYARLEAIYDDLSNINN